jgi:hypothetical protein
VANGRRRPVAPVRRVVAMVLGTVAVFITLFGAGSGSWAVAALGVAVLVLAVGLVVVSAMRGGAHSWIAGSAHVVNASEPPASSTYGRCELQVVIDAPGLPAAAVKVIDPRVPVAKWPDPGATLPIIVAVDDPRHVRVQWDSVLTHTETALREEFGEPEPPLEEMALVDQAPAPAPRPRASMVERDRFVHTEPVAVPVDETPPVDTTAAAATAVAPPAGGPAGPSSQRKPRPYPSRKPRPAPGAGAPDPGTDPTRV